MLDSESHIKPAVFHLDGGDSDPQWLWPEARRQPKLSVSMCFFSHLGLVAQTTHTQRPHPVFRAAARVQCSPCCELCEDLWM